MGRISKRKNPLLFNVLNHGKNYMKYCPETGREAGKEYIEILKKAKKQGYALNINFLTQKFDDAATNCIRGISKDDDDLGELMNTIVDSIADGFYYIFFKNIECLVYINGDDRFFLLGHLFWFCKLGEDKYSILHIFNANTEQEEEAGRLMATFIRSLWFKQNSGIELKSIPGKSRIKAFGCAYKNDTPIPIDILDTNWFTTIIRVKPVIRKGHYKGVWVGKGRKNKKMIWIKETLVNGYTRKARKLNK